MKRNFLRLLLAALALVAVPVIAAMCAARHVRNVSAGHVVNTVGASGHFTGIVLGCRVREGDVSNCLEERLAEALVLYKHGDVQRLLLSGDHGRRGYDEVNAMKAWLLARGVPLDHIFLDHAGFDTYDTMIRARDVFQVKDAVIISQAFHLPRAVYLARSLGIDAVGVIADPPGGSSCRGSAVREPFACLKAWADITFSSAPKFEGPRIPITGSPEASFDQPADEAAMRSER